MVQVDIHDFTITCANCGHQETLDHFTLPTEIKCCKEPQLSIDDEVELDIT